MKLSTLSAGLSACFVSLCALASPSTTPGIHLDQSKNILFDQFYTNTFSLQVLQSKDQFNSHDLILGGSLQLDAQHWQGDKIETSTHSIYQNDSGFYMTQATFDMMLNAGRWSTFFVSMTDNYIARGGPGANYIYFPHAFMTFGNLQEFPAYTTLGISTIPFGVFAGVGPWDTPLTAAYFNSQQAPQISLAYDEKGLNAVVTAFSDEANHENHFAWSVYYNKDGDIFSWSAGAGYLTDLKSNSVGIPAVRRDDRKRGTPIYDMKGVKDLSGNLRYRQVTLIGEYVRGTKTLGVNHGAPFAYAISASYTPKIAGKDTTFGLTYSATRQMKDVPASLSGEDGIPLALAGLKSSWALGVSYPILKILSLGCEIEKEITYSNKNTYTGTFDVVAYL
ncbi:MAG: LbtU family siderophore porin [Gammaproteobacteria bacterium]|nr:LbtU family siderophore porin [Gammaproteobacteria bacterium]